MILSFAVTTLSNLAFYAAINAYIKQKDYRTHLKQGDNRQVWIFRNILCSLVHSTIASIMAIRCFMEKPELFTDIAKIFSEEESYFSTLLLPASTGYFIYDFLDIVLNDGYRQWEVLSHHVAISITLFMTYVQGYYGYSVCSMIIEINSINLHIRRLLRMTTLQFPNLALFNRYLTAVSTIIFRGYFSLHLLFGYLGDKKMNKITTYLGGYAILVMLGTNFGIMYKIYESDYSSKKIKGDSNRLVL